MLAKRLTRRGVALPAVALGVVLAENTVTAALPPALATAAVQAGLTFAAGQTTEISGQAILLAEGAIKAMFVTKLKAAGLVLLVLGVLGGGWGILAHRNGGKGDAALAVPRETATKPPEEKMIFSRPVRVNGVDFRVVTERRWLAPAAPATSRPIELGLRITNRTMEELVFYDFALVHITSLDGKELTKHRLPQARQAARQLAPVKLAAGKSLTVPIISSCLYRKPGLKELDWSGDPIGPLDQVASLQVGQKYNVSLSYKPSMEGKNVWQGQVCTAKVLVEIVEPAVPKETQTKTEPAGGPAVNGLKLILTADNTQPTMKADGWNAEPIKLKLTFANAGDKEIQFAVPSWFSSMTLDLSGADKEKVTTLPLPQAGTPDLSRAKSICLLKSGQSFSMEQPFPTIDFTEYLLKAGSYRLKITYDSKRYSRYNDANFNQQPIPADCWTGTLSSNELVLQVKPPPDSKVKKTFSVKGKLGTGPGTGPNGYWTRTTIRTGDGKLYVLNFGRPDDEQAKKLFHQAWNLSQQGPNETIEVIATGTMLGSDRTMLLVKTFKAADAKEAKPDGKARKTYSVKGKLGVWRTPGPDGRALTTVSDSGRPPLEGVPGYVLYFGKKGDKQADMLYEEASKLYKLEPGKIVVVVTGILRDEGNRKVLEVKSIKAADEPKETKP